MYKGKGRKDNIVTNRSHKRLRRTPKVGRMGMSTGVRDCNSGNITRGLVQGTEGKKGRLSKVHANGLIRRLWCREFGKRRSSGELLTGNGRIISILRCRTINFQKDEPQVIERRLN